MHSFMSVRREALEGHRHSGTHQGTMHTDPTHTAASKFGAETFVLTSAGCRCWDSRDRWGMLRHSPIPNRILMCCASLEYPLLGFPRSAAQTEVRPSGPAGI